VREAEVILYPDDGLVVQRQWEGQMAYVIPVLVRIFCICKAVPMQFTIVPLVKVRVHRIAVFLDGGLSFFPILH
jgi:arrestin-related trafficking adapter 3/6